MAKGLTAARSHADQLQAAALRAASCPRTALRNFTDSYVQHLRGQTSAVQVEAYAMAAKRRGWPPEVLRKLRRILRAYLQPPA